MMPSWLRNIFSILPSRRNPDRKDRRPVSRPDLVHLEDRTVPATFTEAGALLNLDLAANEQVGIVANATTYSLNLTGGTWTGTDSANVTGNGTATLTVTAAGIAAYTDVNLTDSGAGTAATFNDSGANGYGDNFSVTLDSGSAGVTFGGASSFGTNSLSVTTDRNITVNGGATVSTTSGNITLSANKQATPTAGNFVGVQVAAGTVASGTGSVTLSGRGGDTGDQNIGVVVAFGGVVKTTGSGAVTISGTGGASTGVANFGVLTQDAGTLITTGGGNVTVTGIGGGAGGASTNNDGVDLLTGGSQITAGGSGTVTVSGTSGASGFGVYVSGAGSQITSGGGAVTVTGAATVGTAVVTISGGRIASGGNAAITVVGDSMNLTSADSVNAGTGTITLRPSTAATAIDLGAADAAGVLGLTDAELDAITAGVLQIGDATNTGGISFSAAVDPANTPQLELVTAGDITGTGGSDITIARLALTAGGTIGGVGGLGTNVDNFEAKAGGSIFVVNDKDFTIGGVNATLTGVISTASDVDLEAGGTGVELLTINEPVTATGTELQLLTDALAINAAVTSGQNLRLFTFSTGTPIGLGTVGDGAGGLNVSKAELLLISSPLLQVGDAFAGDITVTAAVSTSAGVTSLALDTSGSITQNAGATITATKLLLVLETAGPAATLNEANTVGTFAVWSVNGGNDISFVNKGALTIGTVSTIAGITGANITVSTSSPLIVAADVISSGNVVLTSGDSAAVGDDLSVLAGVTVRSTGGDVTLNAGDNLILDPTSVIKSDVGTINLAVDFNDADAGVGGTLTVPALSAAVAINVVGGPDADNITFAAAQNVPTSAKTFAGADTVNVLSTGVAGPLSIDTGSELDAVFIGTANGVGAPGKLTPVAGAVTVDGGTEGATLVVDGSGAAVDADYAISAATVTRSTPAGFGGVTYSSLTSLLLTVGSGKNVVTVNSTAAGVPTTVNTNAGADTVNVLSTNATGPLSIDTGSELDAVFIGTANGVGAPGKLTPVAGAVTVDGGTEGATLVVDGSGAAVDADYAISAATVTRSTPAGFGGVTYSSLTSLLLTVGSGKNVVTVNSTAAGVPTTVNTNAGADTVNVTGAGLGAALTVDTGTEDDAVTLIGTPVFAVSVDGGAGTDTLTGPDGGATFNITATNAGNVAGASFTAVESLIGGIGADSFVFADSQGVTGTITGGGGTDLLDYSAYTTAVTVSLLGGTATGTGGVAGVENVTGGSAGDTLTGDNNANVLIGGAGNDIITGGKGADVMAGGANDDLLIWNNGDGSDVIDGNGGTDTVQVNGSATAGDAFAVSPGAGGRLNFQRTNLVPFTLDIGTSEVLTVNGGVGDDTFTVSTLTGVTFLTTVNLNGQADNDTFNVQGSPTVTVNVDGGPHTTGDTLNFDAQGENLSTTDTSITSGTNLPVNYTFIETVNFSNVTDLTVDGTGLDDKLVISSLGGVFGYVLTSGGVPGSRVNLPVGLTNFTFNGLVGNDSLVITLLAGEDLPAALITFDGGTGFGTDTLSVTGNGQTGSIDLAPTAADPGIGTVVIGGSAIAFSELEPVDLVGFASFTVTFAGANDVVTVAGDFLDLDDTMDALTVSGTTGGLAFEEVNLRNIGTVVVSLDDATGDDTIDLQTTGNKHGVGSLNVQTNSGADTLTVSGKQEFTGDFTVEAETVSVDAELAVANASVTARGTLDVTAASTNITGTLTLSGTTGTTVSAALKAAVVQITDQTTVALNANVTATVGDLSVAAGNNITAAAGVTLTAPNTNVVALVVDQIGAVDAAGGTIALTGATVAGAGANLVGGGEADTFNLVAATFNTTTVTITGNAGDDSFNLSQYTAAVNLNGGTGTNKVVLDAQSASGFAATGNTFTIGGGGVITPTNVATVTFLNPAAAATTFVLTGTAGNDKLTFQQAVADPGPNYILNNGPVVFFAPVPLVQFVFNGLGGNDTVFVFLTAGQSLSAQLLTFDGGAGGADSLVVSGAGQTASIDLAPTVADPGIGTVTLGGEVIEFSNLEPVDLIGLGTVTVTFAGTNDNVTVAAGNLDSDPTLVALAVSGTTGGLPFESVQLRNNAAVVISTDDAAGDDVIDLQATGTAHGNTTFVVQTNSGTDSLTVSGKQEFAGDFTVEGETVAVNADVVAGTVGVTARGPLTVAGNTKVTATAGDVFLSAGSTLTTAAGAAVTASANVTIQTPGDTAADESITLTGTDVVATAGTITITSADDLTVTGGSLQAGTTATLAIDANSTDAAGANAKLNLSIFTAPGGATLTGGDQADTFTVRRFDVALTVDGKDPTLPLPADTLVFDLQNNDTFNAKANVYTLTDPNTNKSGGPITAVNIETITPINFGKGVIIDGTAADEILTIETDPITGNPSYILKVGAVTMPRVVLFVTPAFFTFNGNGGNDKLIVNLKATEGFRVGPITFDGGTGSDSVQVNGAGQSLFLRLLAAVGPGDGEIRLDSPNSALVLAFSNLEPVDITGMALVSVTFDGADDAITVSKGTLTDGTTKAISISGTSGGNVFEQVNLTNNTVVVIDTNTVAGTDTVTVTGTDAAADHNNRSLVIGTGADKAGDQVSVTGDAFFADDVIVAGLTGTTPNTAAGTTKFSGTANLTTGRDITLRVGTGGATSTKTLDAGNNLLVNTPGSIASATAKAGNDLTLTAGGTINSTTATAAAGKLTFVAGGTATSGTATATAGALSITGNAGVTSTTAAAGTTLQLLSPGGPLNSTTATAGGAATLSAGGNLTSVTATSTGSSVTITSTGGSVNTTTATANDFVIVTASGDILSDTATATTSLVSLTSTNGSVTSNKATAKTNVNLTAANDIKSTTADAGQSVTLTAGKNVTSTTATAGAGFVTITATNGTLASTAVTAKTTATLTAKSDITSGTITAGGAVQVTSSAGSVTTNGKTQSTAANVAITGAGDVTINAAVQANQSISIAAGKALTTGTNGTPAVLTDGGTLTSNTGSITLSGGGSVVAIAVTLGANVTANGSVSITAGPDLADFGQDVFAVGGLAITATTGGILISAADDIELTNTVLTAAGAVTLLADVGASDTSGGTVSLIGATIAAGSATLTGNSNDDTFLIEAGYGTLLSIDGGAQHGTGDVLRVAGKTVTVDQGTITAAAKPVTFTNIETVLLDGAGDATRAATSVTVSGGANDDVIAVSRTAATTFTIVDDGQTFVAPAVTTLAVNGAAGNDRVRFTYTGFGTAFPTTTTVDGGTGTNGVAVVGSGPATDVTYTADAAVADTGVLANGAKLATLTNTQNLDLSAFGTVTLRYAGKDDVLTATPAADAFYQTIPSILIDGTTGGTATTAVSVSTATALQILTTDNDGNDSLAITGTIAGTGVRDLTVDLGAGTDAITQAGSLTITGKLTTSSTTLAVNGAIGFGTNANEPAALTTTGTITVAGSLIGNGNITLTALDQAAGDQSITVSGEVRSKGGNVTILAGDNLTITGTVAAVGPITLLIDAGNADAGTGATADLRGATVATTAAGSTLTGNTDNDTFLLTPLLADLTVDGKAPTGTPTGDALSFDAKGQNVIVGPASFQVEGGKTLSYTDIEQVTLVNAKVTTANGSNGDDRLTISRVAGAFTYQFDGQPAVTQTTDPTSFTFNGLAGKDTFIVQYSGGDPVPVGGATFDGGADADIGVCVLGTGTQTAVYRSTSPTSGTVTVDGKVIGFAGLEASSQIDITKMTTLTVTFGTTEDTVSVTEGFDATIPTKAIPALIVSGPAFVPVGAWNNANLIIDTTTVDGSDTVTVFKAANAHNNANLTVNTGTTGTDIVNVRDDVAVTGNLTIQTQRAVFEDGADTTAGGTISLAGGTVLLRSAVLTAGTRFEHVGGGGLAVGDGAAATVVAGTGGAEFAGPIDGQTNNPFGGLTVNTAGLTRFGGAVGGTTKVASLTTDALGTTRIDGAGVAANVAITLLDPVTYSKDGTFFKANAATGITVGQTLDPAVPGLAASFAAPGQRILFNGAVGGTNRLGLTTIDDAADVTFNSSLTATAFVQTKGSGATTFNGPVDISADGLRVTTAGNVTANAAVSVTSGAVVLTGVAATTFNSTLNARLFQETGGRGDTTFVGPVVLTAAEGAKIQTTGSVTTKSSFAAAAGPVVIDQAANVTIGGPLTALRLAETNGTGTTTLNGAVTVTQSDNGQAAVSRSAAAVSLAAKTIAVNAPLNAGNGDVVFLPTGGGVSQSVAGNLFVRRLVIEGAGPVSLPNKGNVTEAASGGDLFVATTGGAFEYRETGDLRLTFEAGTTNPAISVTGGDVTLTAGLNFTASVPTKSGLAAGVYDPNTPLISAPGKTVQVFVGADRDKTQTTSIVYTAEVNASKLVLGTDGADRANVATDTFVVAPSQKTPVFVNGNSPRRGVDTFTVGDRLSPVFTNINAINLAPNGQDNGTFTFGGTGFQVLVFTSIEATGGLGVDAAVVQTGPRSDTRTSDFSYAIRAQASQVLAAGTNMVLNFPAQINGRQIPPNSFIVSPTRTDPTQPQTSPNLAIADVNGDGSPDIIIANGPGNAPIVTVINGLVLTNPGAFGALATPNADGSISVNLDNINQPGNPLLLAQFYAYEPDFFGGVTVAAGDFNGDGRAEIITGTGAGGGQRIRAFSFLGDANPSTGSFDANNVPVPNPNFNPYNNVQTSAALQALGRANFFAFAGDGAIEFRGGVNVAVGDVNGDGTNDLIAGAGIDGGPRVIVYDGKTGAELRSFFAYDPNFRGGVLVAAGRIDADTNDDIVTAPGRGGGPDVRVFYGLGVTNNPNNPNGTRDPNLSIVAVDPETVGGTGLIATAPSIRTGINSIGVGSSPDGTGANRTILVGTPRGQKTKILRYTSIGQPLGDLLTLLDDQTTAAERATPALETDVDFVVNGVMVDTDQLTDGGVGAGFSN